MCLLHGHSRNLWLVKGGDADPQEMKDHVLFTACCAFWILKGKCQDKRVFTTFPEQIGHHGITISRPTSE